MTTSILDFVNNKAVSDTRWSVRFVCDNEEYLAYHDDTRFFKITSDASVVMILAGDAHLIATWKTWLKQGATEPYPPFLMPNSTRWVVPVVALQEDNQFHLLLDPTDFFTSLHEPIMKTISDNSGQELCFMIGSGKDFACEAWQDKQCFQDAIDAAAKGDYYTSSSIECIPLMQQQTDKCSVICDDVDLNDVSQLLAKIVETGFYFCLTNKELNMKPIPLNTHPTLQLALLQQVTRGEAFASSPISLTMDVPLMLQPDVEQKMNLVVQKIAQAKQRQKEKEKSNN